MKLSRVNTALVVVIIAVNIFTIAMPVIPAVSLWIRKHTDAAARLEARIHSPDGQHEPSENRLIIPSILLDEKINEGADSTALRSGLWRRPFSAAPDQSSNTVITGHRFTYNDPQGTFYHLDKLRVGDDIGIIWNDKTYLYKVTNYTVVPATATEIEAPTDTPRLTLYTCTPLWFPKDRLVVTAEPWTQTTEESYD